MFLSTTGSAGSVWGLGEGSSMLFVLVKSDMPEERTMKAPLTVSYPPLLSTQPGLFVTACLFHSPLLMDACYYPEVVITEAISQSEEVCLVWRLVLCSAV